MAVGVANLFFSQQFPSHWLWRSYREDKENKEEAGEQENQGRNRRDLSNIAIARLLRGRGHSQHAVMGCFNATTDNMGGNCHGE